MRLFGGRCARCGARAIAPAPSGLEPGSPFGQSIAAVVVYPHYAHTIGLQRLAASARVSGKTWWEWVFVGTLAVLHVIPPSRRRAVVQALFGTVQPMVWVSDMLGSPRGHGWSGRSAWRICCAMHVMPSSAALSPSAPR